MSTERTSSAVRNLRSIFENKAGDSSPSPDSRGRSTSGLTTSDKENSRPTSRIRASFVSVGPSGGMATMTENGTGEELPELRRESSAGLRRGSFTATEASDEGGLLELKKTVSQEAERREKDSSVAEAIPETVLESGAATPKAKSTQDFSEDNVDDYGDDFIDDGPLSRGQQTQSQAQSHGEQMQSQTRSHEGQAQSQSQWQSQAPSDESGSTTNEEHAKSGAAKPTSVGAVNGDSLLPPAQKTSTPNGRAKNTIKAHATPTAKATPTPATKSPKSTLRVAPKPATATPNGKPSSMSIKSPAKSTFGSVKSSTSQPNSPRSVKSAGATNDGSPKSAAASQPAKKASRSSLAASNGSPKATPAQQPSKKASRSSLTAPTASSVARAAGTERTVSTSSKQSTSSSKPKPREGTKTIDLPSRLTAPTAASRAKHETNSAAPSGSGSLPNGKPAITSRPKSHASSAKPTPRSSLDHAKRPGSRAAQDAKRPGSRAGQVPRKPAAPADGSFLERMMRPTTASSSKLQEKTEPKSPPRARKTAPPPKPKSNGQLKKPAVGKSSSRPSTAKSTGTEKAVPAAGSADEASENDDIVEAAKQAAKELKLKADPPADLPVTHGVPKDSTLQDKEKTSGSETPVAQTNGHANGEMEATPAAIGGEETIR